MSYGYWSWDSLICNIDRDETIHKYDHIHGVDPIDYPLYVVKYMTHTVSKDVSRISSSVYCFASNVKYELPARVVCWPCVSQEAYNYRDAENESTLLRLYIGIAAIVVIIAFLCFKECFVQHIGSNVQPNSTNEENKMNRDP